MDEDLVAHLEKKIKKLEAERDHWKANHDNQVNLKAAIADRPDLGDRAKRVADLVAEIDQCKILNELCEKQIFETNSEIARLFDSLMPSGGYVDLVRGASSQANVAFDWLRAHSEIDAIRRELTTERMQRKEIEALAKSLEAKLDAASKWAMADQMGDTIGRLDELHAATTQGNWNANIGMFPCADGKG